IRATDATLLDEWELLSSGAVAERAEVVAPTVAPAGSPAAWRTAVRTAAFGWVEMLAARNHEAVAARTDWTVEHLDEAMAPYWEQYDAVLIDGDARSASFFDLVAEPAAAHDDGDRGRWVVTQRLADPDGDGEWRLVATVDLAAALEEGAPSLRLE